MRLKNNYFTKTYDHIILLKLFDLSMRFNGFPIKKAQHLLKSIQSIPEAEYSMYLSDQKKTILTHHLNNTPFYKLLAKNIDSSDWSSVPIMTKRDLQQPLKNRLSRSYSLNNVYINKTSGSSGDPFTFAKDKFCHALTWAIFEEWYGWHTVFNGKQGRFYGIPLDKKSYYKERVKDLALNRYRFNVFDLTEGAFDNWIKKFNNKRFIYITGYTSVLVAFAQHLLSKQIVLSKVCPTLQACLTTSEMCSETEREQMRKAFNIAIINEYGAAEFGLIALENDNHWNLNNVNLYIEVLDYKGNPVPEGQSGRIIITDLYNKAHPFIRYEIGDVGSIKKINQKKLFLDHLVGRKEDYIKLPSGKLSPGLSFYYVTKSIMDSNCSIKEIKIKQHAIDIFEVEYVSKVEMNNTQKKKVKTALNKYLEKGVRVYFSKKNQLERTTKGKLKQFTSYIKS